jgi:hypothetical protein
MNRAERRRLKKKNKGNEKLAQKISTFEHRPDTCSACDAAFDAKSREHAMTWRVVVHENPTRVSLFCPQCIQKAQEALDGKTRVPRST